MRKLRDDFTLKEAWKWATDKSPLVYGEAEDRLVSLAKGRPPLGSDFPESFYVEAAEKAGDGEQGELGI